VRDHQPGNPDRGGGRTKVWLASHDRKRPTPPNTVLIRVNSPLLIPASVYPLCDG
jgi:hypothetical protein